MWEPKASNLKGHPDSKTAMMTLSPRTLSIFNCCAGYSISPDLTHQDEKKSGHAYKDQRRYLTEREENHGRPEGVHQFRF